MVGPLAVVLPLGRCGAVVVVAVALALGVWEAYLTWEVSASAHLAPNLLDVDTFRESDLPWETFYEEYVLKRRPVKIVLSRPDGFNLSRLEEQCGKNKVTLLSDATYTAMLDIENERWLHRLFDWVAMPLIGRWTTLPKELRSRLKVPLTNFLGEAREPTASKRPFSLPIPLFLLRLLPTEILLLLEVFARPRYLHDTSLKRVCRDALDWIHVPRHLFPNWFHTSFLEEESFQKQVKDEPTFFIGKAHTLSYPMHRNIYASLDFGLLVLEGAKRFSVFDVEEHSKLSPFDVGGSIWLYLVDAFAPDMVANPRYRDAKGWRGVLNAGEMLWAPGDSIHSFENYDFDGPTVAVKFWYTSHVSACGSEADAAACVSKFGVQQARADGSAPSVSEYLASGARERARAAKLARTRDE